MAEVLAISLPMVISCACDTVMIFTDRLFLARLKPELMNAALGGGLTVFMVTAFFAGLLGFTTALVAQHLGAGKKQECSVVLTQALIFALLSYPIVLLLRLPVHRLFELMGVEPGQLGPQVSYFNILIYGSIISLIRTGISGFFSGIARTRIVMFASAAAMLANVVLDYIFIFGKFGFPAMGIQGAAYATLLGGITGLSVLFTVYFGARNRREYGVVASFRFDRRLSAKLLRYGSPTGLEMCLNIIAFNCMVMMFHSLGPVAATAATIVFNWDLVSFVPLIGIEIGVTSLVGKYMGAGQPHNSHRSVMSGLRLGMFYSVIVLAFFLFFTNQLVGVFRPAQDNPVFNSAFPTAAFMVRLASVYVLVEAMLCVFIGALRGAGDTLWAMCASVLIHWLMAFVLAFILRFMRLGPEAGWAAMVSFFLVFSAVVFLRYRQGKWRKIRIVEPAVPAELLPKIGEV